MIATRALEPAWFRFQWDAGTKNAQMRDNATGWLNGAHPKGHDGKLKRQVCFNLNSNCCSFSVNIQVQNCSGYYLYYIDGTYPWNPCYLRFCGTD